MVVILPYLFALPRRRYPCGDLYYYNWDNWPSISGVCQQKMPNLEDLHQAIRLREPKTVNLLLSTGTINLNSSLRSTTALSLAVFQGAITIVEILLENGADPNKLSHDWNGRLETPLFSACRLGNFEIAKILIHYNADVNITDFYNHSPLWIATRERKLDLVKLLINSGAKLNIANKVNQCPLYIATKYLCREQIATLLIQNGCALDFTDLEGHGAIYWSLANNQLSIFKLLIHAGAYVSLRDREQLTSSAETVTLPADIRQNKDFCDWISSQLRNAPSLLNCCTRQIRKHLSTINQGRSISMSVDKLPIPDTLKGNILLKNFNDKE